ALESERLLAVHRLARGDGGGRHLDVRLRHGEVHDDVYVRIVEQLGDGQGLANLVLLRERVRALLHDVGARDEIQVRECADLRGVGVGDDAAADDADAY